MGVSDNDLIRLRQAIFKREWQGSFQIERVLFARNVSQSILIVANQMARTCLRFQGRYDLGWVTRFGGEITYFIQAGSTEAKPPPFPIEAKEKLINIPPGVSNLVAGVEELWKGLSVTSDPDERAIHLVNALSEFITGELCQFWEAVHPEEWKLREAFWNVKGSAEGELTLPAAIDLDQMYIGIKFLKQPESTGYQVARWLSIADEIEMTLRR